MQNHFGVRCDPSVPYDPGFQPPERRAARRAGAGVDLAAELRRAVPGADRDRRAGLRGAVAHARAVGRLVDDLHDDRPARAAHLPALVPRPARARRAPTSWRRRRCGTSTSRPRSRRPSSRIASARARCTACASRWPPAPNGDAGDRRRRGADRDDAPGADPRLRRAAGPPRRRAPARARRQGGADAAVRHARAGAHASARRARQGHGPGDGLHVRRPDRRGVVARAGPAGALGARPGRPPGRGAVGRAGVGGEDLERGARELRGAARAGPSTRRASGSSSCWSSRASSSASRRR